MGATWNGYIPKQHQKGSTNGNSNRIFDHVQAWFATLQPRSWIFDTRLVYAERQGSED
jgi:hypothetical protein